MRPANTRRRPYTPARLRDIISREFDSDPLALALFDEFLSGRAYSRSLALKLIDVAKGKVGATWELRRLAALMLENQILKLSAEDASEFDLLFVNLGLKPSGSTVEFEVKRAGRRRDLPLNVVYRRNDWTVPPPHRLDGGSMLTFLRREARAASRFSAIYRRVHASEAPLSVMVSRRSILGVPRNGTEENILEYFTNPRLFGDEYGAMREFMEESVAAFDGDEEEQ